MIKLKRNILFVVAFLLLSLTACGGKIKNPQLVINEVMIVNESNYMDEFGQRNAWIEIYNNTAATKNVGGMFLTTDKNNPKMYAIPLGDVLTQIKPHQHRLFWADNEPFHGTFHTNFKIDPTRENYIALYDVDGKTLVDEITIPAGMEADRTYGYEIDGVKYDNSGNILAKVLDRATPSSNNQVVGENPKIVSLKETDQEGLMLTITSMLVVFVGLILLFLIFNTIGNTASNMSKKRKERKSDQKNVEISTSTDSSITGDEIAAISAALHELMDDQHDVESSVLTIQQIQRNYSPWSFKAQTLRRNPRR